MGACEVYWRTMQGEVNKFWFSKVYGIQQCRHFSEKLFRKQLLRKVGPAWFQELAENQTNAVDSIFDAVSDNELGEQFELCHQALKTLGLEPLPIKSDLVSAIQFSQGNDLAFFWFLYDKVYNACPITSSKQTFSLNERLILSSICHLDMMSTLRELDRILPPVKKKPKKRTVSIACQPVKYLCPYDEPTPKPKLQPLRCITEPKRIHPKFAIYRRYKDSCYVIRNETNRWFAEKNLMASESRNIAREIICEEIKKIVDGNFDREAVMNGLCEKHRTEATKFNRMMRRVLTELSQPNPERAIEDKLEDYDIFERGIIYGVQVELTKFEDEFRDLSDSREKRVIAETILRQIIEQAAELKYIHLCEKCEDCCEEKRKLMPSVTQVEACKSETESSEPSEDDEVKFFHRPTTLLPCRFDYENIFSSKFLNDCGAVKNSINAVLKLDKHLTEDNAIMACLRDMWRNEMKAWNEKQVRVTREKEEYPFRACGKIGKNKRKVFCLLRVAIDLMRKNPKFVLVSFPDVERLPILRTWILLRYGFRFDDAYNEKLWKVNKVNQSRIVDERFFPEIEVPKVESFGAQGPSICYDKVIKNSKIVRSNFEACSIFLLFLSTQRDAWIKNYFHTINTKAIEANRLLWSTMEPLMCDTERMRQIFYAYMSPRLHDCERTIMNQQIG